MFRSFRSIFLRSGGVYYGGLIGGFLTVALLIRFYKLPFWKVADALVPGLALGQAFGRQGCFAAGCCWGKPTDLWWGVHFTEQGHEYTGVPMYGPDGSRAVPSPDAAHRIVYNARRFRPARMAAPTQKI